MHTVVALSSVHRRKLVNSTSSPGDSEARQYSLALACYNSRLSSPMNQEDSDALLATATLINAYAFASTSSADAERCWPLTSSPNSLQWLAVQQGPSLIMASIAQWLPQSVFLASFADFNLDPSTPLPSNPDAPVHLMPRFYALCADDPIYKPYLDMLAPLLPLNPTTANMAQYLPFISSLQPPFCALLQRRDSRALLVLAWWYALICPLDQWWLKQRVRTECMAICMFLERDWGRDSRELGGLLDFPARRCEYRLREQREGWREIEDLDEMMAGEGDVADEAEWMAEAVLL